MKILVCGATGGSGQHLVERALARDHQVVAQLRDPAKLRASSERLQVVQADMLDLQAMRDCVTADLDAVISALGQFNKSPSTQLSRGTANLIAAMQDAGVKRLICISSWGAGGTDAQAAFWTRLLVFKILFGFTLADKNRQETLIRASDLDYTILRPAGLRDREPEGETYVWGNTLPKQELTFQVSRRYLADFCLDCLDDQKTIRTEMNMSE